MATYASLTDAEKESIALADRHYRTFLRRFTRLVRDVDFDNAETFIAAVVDPLVTSLDTGQAIPNATDFAGAQPLTKAQFQAMQNFIRGFKTTLSSNAAALSKAIGINAE